MKTVSKMDEDFYRMAREHIDQFLDGKRVWTCSNLTAILEVGPDFSMYRGRRGPGWHTLGLADDCTYQVDITQRTPISDSTYDVVLAMEVLEHTLDPVAALAEIRRILKPGGLLLASAPWGFRIHGPQPDLWRFNQNTWRLLLKDWDDLTLDVLDDPNRWLMPIHINVSARCNKEKNVNAREMEWPLID